MVEIEVGAGRDPNRHFAGYRSRNPALFSICGICGSAGFCGIIPAESRPANVFKSYSCVRDPANTILPTSSLKFGNSVEKERF